MPLATLERGADLSWMEKLTPDPESSKHSPNKTSREVKSGHYVPVFPTPLPNPKLLIYSKRFSRELGFTEEDVKSSEFLRFFSGDMSSVPAMKSWCTPYALSIMGTKYTSNCPFGNGNGYGDGRAVSVGESILEGQRWEFQLKGGGTTPFCRGADGRAVLRSSIREFLASEAMDALNIGTTRAISLILSTETARRPWYSGRPAEQQEVPDLDDPRIAHLPLQYRKLLIEQLSQPSKDPDIMVTEPCAITCRVSPSFLRVGHIDLFAIRARDGTEQQKAEHAAIVEHALFREFPSLLPDAPLPDRALAMVPAVADRLATLAAEWIRVGFCQGNFNADNCLVGGRTMDYGPFGFIDKFDPLFAKWTGSGEHFAFMNQTVAAYTNFAVLAESLDPLFENDPEGLLKLKGLVETQHSIFTDKLAAVWARKMGLPVTEKGIDIGGTLWQELKQIIHPSNLPTDWTIFWRQLPKILDHTDESKSTDNVLIAPIMSAFYASPSPENVKRMASWLRSWLSALENESRSIAVIKNQMNGANPKYIPREWMLVDTYKAAGEGNMALLHELHELFENPYAEQPAMEEKYYKRAPDEALTKQGTAFMT